MPTSGFETALIERIEYAVFVAYEQWVRVSNYAAPNPYDVLARILPGLPEALSESASARGGWGMFDPVSGLPADASRQLIGEMAAQVVSARVAALAPHAPDANLLAQVMVDAISRSVTVFVDDPESWRLALTPNERGPTAALRDPVPEHAASDAGPNGQDHSPGLPGDEGGESGGATHSVVRAAESPAETGNFLQLAEFWFIKSSSTLPGNDTTLSALNGLLVSGSSSLALIEAGKELADEIEDLRDGTDDVGSPVQGDPLPIPPGVSQQHLDALDDLPQAIQAVIAKWIKLLNEASFWRVDADGGRHELSDAEAHEVVDTLIGVLIRRAELDLDLPTLPGNHAPSTDTPATPTPTPTPEAPKAADPPAAVATDRPDDPGLGDKPVGYSDLGSGTIEIPPAPPEPEKPPADVVLTPAPSAEATEPAVDLVTVHDQLGSAATVLPPIIKEADPLFV